MPRNSHSSQNARSSSAVLRALTDPELAPPASRLEGRPLRPEAFRPESGRDNEADGAPLTKFGGRFREVFAEAQKISVEEVDLGLIRLVEALNADTQANLAALSAPQMKRTEQGVLHQVRLRVNTPIVMPWLLNGRALRRMAAELNGHARLVTEAKDHERLSLPVMDVGGPEDVREIVGAQRRLLGLDNYAQADGKKKDRIDSLVRFGVLETPDVVLTELRMDTGETAWTCQAAEGAQRLFSSTLALDVLANRSTSAVGSAHWFDSIEPRLRNYTASDLRRLDEQLRFTTSAAASYFPGSDVPTWLDTIAATTPGAVAFQLLRTMEVSLIIAVTPDPTTTTDEDFPVVSVLQEMIRSYHMPGKAKDSWLLGDVQGLIAIGVIDELQRQQRITERERSAWLGEQEVSWQGPPTAADDGPGNRVAMITKLIAAMTAQSAIPSGPEPDQRRESLEVVNDHLRRNSIRRHADERARVGAAQAVVALRVHNSGQEGTIAAALIGTFNSPWFWRANEHPTGSWVSLLDMPIHELAEKARAELASSLQEAGPAQRALAALGGVSLMVHPLLVEQGKALSRTGRGGGGKAANVRASDPVVLLQRMIQDPRGLNQLEDAVVALVAPESPSVPVDRDEPEVLTDLWLRDLWLGKDPDESDDPITEFTRQIQLVVAKVTEAHGNSVRLRTATREDMLDVPDEERDPELPGESLFEAVGINAQAADEAVDLLRELTEFFTLGKLYAKVAGGPTR
ncbi:hypothetical protein ACWKWC_03890 [Geodermatophilus nigrescens]